MADDKKTLFIEGKEVEFTDEPNLLEVIRKAGMNVPTFCYRPDLTSFGACRMCVVEVEYPNGRKMINSSCTMPPEAGIKVHLNTEATRRIRKTVLELLLANHDRKCLTCEKSGSCDLQKYAEEYGITNIRFPDKALESYLPVDDSSPSIVRDPNKCILCGACVRACTEFQGHSVLGFTNRGSKTLVQPMNGRPLAEVDCVNCGQCAAVCPTGALTIKNDTDKVWSEITNPNKTVVVQVAPATRVALGEMFGLEPGENTIRLMNAALRRLGFNYVFDTNFSADLTIVEEATEFLGRLQKGENLPLFTSCCPAWIRYLETQHPDMLHHLSSCKSPMSMLSPVLVDLVPKYFNVDRDNLVVVAVMPCTAKKYECKRPELGRDGRPDTDYVITTQELGKMIRTAGIDFKALEPEDNDSPFGEYTGAGTIFGASGGVAEAAVRTAYEFVTGEDLNPVDIKEMRGTSNRSKTVELDIKGTKVVVRVVSTLKEAEKAIQEIKSGKANFHMLEVMACPGGCINGGGQPRSCDDSTIKGKRAEGLYKEDRELPLRKSHKNPSIQKLYNEFLEKPNSHKAHEMLHTVYEDRFSGSYKDV
ncbi:MAG: NADH-dependent [FeFe] hydrogenase, group A6 [Candidatus Gastranaerophilaceae bacterium]|nr:NADH-dependent [FeFe] hydrogenase, group A6 [Candidatus Gastranaerophilaceae bacterium]